jgi:hypothetical protein
MSCREASTCGSWPRSRSAALVTGPMLTTRVLLPNSACSSKKATVEDEVKVT